MSKTNHRDGTVKKRYWLGQSRGPRYDVWGGGRLTADGKPVGAGVACTSECSRTIARGRRGAKKFVNSRVRFRDRMVCAKIVREGYDE